MKYSLFVALILLAIQGHASTSTNEIAVDTDTNWFVSGFSLASIEGEAAQDGGARTTTYNYASFNYINGPGTHYAIRLPFVYQTAGFDAFNEDEPQKQGLNLADVLVDYTDSSTLLPGEFEVFSRFRLELPVSESSIDQKKVLGVRTDLIISRWLARGLEVEYWPIFTWNIHSLTVYENEFGTLSHTKIYELDHKVTLWYKASEKTSVGFFLGGDDDWFNASKNNDTRRQREGRLGEHSIKLGPAVRYVFNKNVVFLANVANNVPLWGFTEDRAGEVNDLGRFRPEHTEFVLLTFLNF